MSRSKIIIEPGARSGRLTAIREVEPDRNRRLEVRCDCGNVRTIYYYSFNKGHSKSCGCQNGTHHLAQTPVYWSWASIIQRCYNPKHPHFDLWGGRGITVCPEWREGFEAFYRDMGSKPSPKHSLDRIDNNGNYSKENCRWVTRDIQASNQRRASFLDLGGEQVTFSEAMRRTGLSKNKLRYRLRSGWTLERLLTPPTLQRGQELANDVPSYLNMPEESSNGSTPKSKTHKKVTRAISWNTSTGILTLQWIDDETTDLNLGELPQDIVNDLAYFGLLARVQQNYVSAAGSPAVARERTAKLWTQLRSNDWGLRRGEQSKFSITVKALAVLLKTSEAEAQARFAALSPEKKKEVGARSDVLAKIGELKAAASKPQASLASILK